MHQITDIFELEALIGKPPEIVLLKQLAKLDQGCIQLLAHSPVAGFGYLTQAGRYYTTLVGGTPGFVRVKSPTSVSFDLPRELTVPTKKSGASCTFLLPGLGETLRLNGSITDVAAGSITLAVEEVYIHCARAILRARLWSVPPANLALVAEDRAEALVEPLHEPAITNMLAASPFLFVSSWDMKGTSNTSPRGDEPGFLRILDGKTLALPDRKGNQRTDTFHNILSSNQVSLVALVPGSDKLLHLSGNASLTTDERLLATMSLNGKPPHAALLLDVKRASITHSEALAKAKIWLPSAHVDPRNVPDMMALALQHMALNESSGLMATVGRFLGRLFGDSPKLVRAFLNVGYQSQLQAEGYAAAEKSELPKRTRSFWARLVRTLSPKARQKTPNVLATFSSHRSRDVNALDRAPGSLPMKPDSSLRREVRVVALKRETSAAITLVLEDITGNSFEFKPGQFFTVLLEINGQQVRRSYSASNAPGTTRLAITIKLVTNGLFSNYVHQKLKSGDTLVLFGPSGTFCVTPEPTATREYVLLASGSGVTPLMSIAQTVLATELASTLTVFYGNRRWEDVIFAQAWADLCQRYPNRLRVRHLLSVPHPGWVGDSGRLDEATTRRQLLRLAPSARTHFYVCGPEPMMQGVTTALRSLGVTADRIQVERFGQRTPLAASTALPPPTTQLLTVQQQGKNLGEVLVPPGQTLLQAGLTAQLSLPFSCGMGNCGECRVKLVAGEVELAEPNCLSADDRQQGYILTCVARPLTATTVDLPEGSC